MVKCACAKLMSKMSYCRKEGKDTIVFTTKEDHEKPSTVQISEPEPSPGLIFPDGSINWNCPCLGGMATGPCGVEFRDAFECFHYSKADPKGSDCFGKFQDMQDCFTRYPKVYENQNEDKEDFMIGEGATSEGNRSTSVTSNGNGDKNSIESKSMEMESVVGK